MNRLSLVLAFAWWVLPGGISTLRAAPRNEVGSRSEAAVQEGTPEHAAQTLFARMAESAGLLGKGSVRVLVLPVSLLQSRAGIDERAIQGGPTEDSDAEERAEPEPSYWFPNVMVASSLTDRRALEEEIFRLLRTRPASGGGRPGAPSATLIALLESSQQTAREAAMMARSIPPPEAQPRGETLGRGVPWKGAVAPKTGRVRGAVAGKKSGEIAAKAGMVPPPTLESTQNVEERYVAVLIQAPFHAFGETPDETIDIELSGDEVARVRGKAQDWAWVQLDSGLMGVIRNRFLRDAAPGEIERFLALEESPGGGGAGGLDIGVMDLDAYGRLIQSEAQQDGEDGSVGPKERPAADKGREIEATKSLE